MKYFLTCILVLLCSPLIAQQHKMLHDSCVALERIQASPDGTHFEAIDYSDARYCQGFIMGFIEASDFIPSADSKMEAAAKSIVTFIDAHPNDVRPLKKMVLEAWLRDGLILAYSASSEEKK